MESLRVPPVPGSLLMSAAGAAWVAIAAVIVGAAVQRAMRGRAAPEPLPPVALAVLGAQVLGLALLALSALGRVSASHVVGLLGVLTAAGLVTGRREIAVLLASTRRYARTRGLQPLGWCAVAALACLLAGALAFGSLPSVFYDDLVYHLGLPMQALAWGRWPAWPTNYYTLIPAGWDILGLVPFALRGGTGLQSLNGLALAGLSLTVHRLAKRHASREAAWAATALLLVAPMFLASGAFAGNDLLVALGLLCALERVVASEGRQWLVAGLLAGAAFSAKTVALPAVVGACAAAFVAGDVPIARRGKRALALGATAAAVSAPWWIRSWALTGNPLHPALSRLFPDRHWDSVSRAQLESMISHGGHGDRGWLALPGSAWDLLVRSETLGYPSGLAPAFVLLGLLGLLGVARARRTADARPLTAFVLVAWLGWCASSLNVRYGIAMLAALTPFAARVIDAATRALTAACQARGLALVARTTPVAALAALLAVAGTRAVGDHARRTAFADVGDREGFTARRVDLVALGRALDALLPVDAVVMLVGDPRVAAIPRRALASGPHDPPWILEVVREAADATAIDAALRARGVTHVVVNVKEMRRLGECCDFFTRFSAEERVLFDQWLAAATPLASHGECLAFAVAR